MSTNTPNYNLRKPAPNDFYNIAVFNENADILDAELRAVNVRVDGVAASGQGSSAALTAHTEAPSPHVGHETPAGAQAKVDAHAGIAAPHSGHATVGALNTHAEAAAAQLSALRTRLRMEAM